MSLTSTARVTYGRSGGRFFVYPDTLIVLEYFELLSGLVILPTGPDVEDEMRAEM